MLINKFLGFSRNILKMSGACFGLALLLFCSVSFARAQSAERNNPTPIKTTEITGEAVASNTEYFYSVTAGPGDFSITPEVTSNDFSCAFSVDILDSRDGSIGKSTIVATGKHSEIGAAKKIRLARRQLLILRLTFDGNASNFRVKLGGAINLPNANVVTNARVDTPQNSMQVQPVRRVLRIEMNDGSAQEFDLERVTQITVRPN